MKETLTIKKLEEQVLELYKEVQTIDFTEYVELVELLESAGSYYPKGVWYRDEYVRTTKSILKYINGLMNEIIDAKMELIVIDESKFERSIRETSSDIADVKEWLKSDIEKLKVAPKYED